MRRAFYTRTARAIERPTHQSILDWLRLQRVQCCSPGQAVRGKNTAGVGRAMIGLPDIIVFLPWGQALGIEVKRPGQTGGLRIVQAEWILETARLAPGMAMMVTDTLDEVISALGPPLAAWRAKYGAIVPETPRLAQLREDAIAMARAAILQPTENGRGKGIAKRRGSSALIGGFL